MRKRHRRTSGVSLGTIAVLTLLGLVVIGCAYLFPRLIGNINTRVDAQQVSVAIDDSLRSLRGQITNSISVTAPSPDETPATAPPNAIATFSAPTPTPTQSVVRSLSITATGSIAIDTKIQSACSGADGYTFDPVFANISSAVHGDINIATLENLVVSGQKLSNINMPSDALAAISRSGINVISNGFFGAFNLGVSGLNATQQAITAGGMTAYGVFDSQTSRDHVVTMQIRDTMVALLSFQSELSSAGKKATTQEEQAFAIAPLTLPTIAADISAARAAGAQIVIVSLCWGKTGATQPTDSQREMAQSIADAGADIILGTHSGTLQTIEMLTGTRADGTTHQTLCAYSLGYLLDSDRSDRDSISGLLLHMNLSYDLSTDKLTFDNVTYTPTYIFRGKIDGKTTYRLVQSNASPADFMTDSQLDVMGRCLKLVQERLADSFVTELNP